MSTHDKQSPVMLDDLLAEGELTLAELARIIGGADPLAASTISNPFPDPFAPLPQSTLPQFGSGTGSVPNSTAPATTDFGIVNKDLLSGNTDAKVPANIDSAYTSYLGAMGTSRNEANTQPITFVPLNITSKFP